MYIFNQYIYILHVIIMGARGTTLNLIYCWDYTSDFSVSSIRSGNDHNLSLVYAL